MTKAEFIRKQLGSLAHVDFSNPKQARILCPFHPDTKPSCDVALQRIQKKRQDKIVNIGVGTFNCWSCKEHGPWNKLALQLNLEQWDEKKEEEYEDYPNNDFGELARDLAGMERATAEYVAPKSDGPWEGPWRGIPGSFLRSLGAQSLWDHDAGEYRILLPISDAFGKRIGHVAARGDNSKIPDNKKYLNSKGFNGVNYWYGLNFEVQPKVLVIVEGPFDMIRFRFHGIPAIANLGVQLRNDESIEQTVSDEKISQIISSGCTKVVLAFDADEAGRAAVPGFTKCFQKWGIEVFNLNMSRYLLDPAGKMDPGNCPMEVIDDLLAFVQQLRGAA